ncbi:MAG TPA: indole-3-glycerol phosphate synthase TrpC, partial [Chloroflexia bacterium]|nr:indole-3-glycerol phosphate synthase TrpC [Chloroflexia bacterium]
ELAQRRAAESLVALIRRAGAMPPPRDFAAAITRRPDQLMPQVIAEIKRGSPSRGLLHPDLDPGALARAYAAGGAAALSVLTDHDFFGGSFADLAAARAAVPLPVLRKDFLLDEYGVVESRAQGADAVLLIVALLDTPTLRRLYELAGSLGMAVLVEVHDAAEMAAAAVAGATIVGVNNRDLHTFTVDLGLTAQLAPLRPPGALLVAESGIRTPADVQRLAAGGADCLLVGESLVTAPDPAAHLRALLAAPSIADH